MNLFGKKDVLQPVALLLVCLIAYLPVSSFLFSLKNDAFLYNFPNKFFFSEALHAGYLPTWNPYLNYGFPLYADPGFAWWQPITWLFGLIGYNAYTFTIEVLFYIYISGLGMYWLGKKLALHPATAFAIGCMFMCNGFFVGNLQHINFLTCAAFLPWLTGTWVRYQQDPSTKNAACCALAIYLLCTGGHPAIPIAAGYFFALLTVLYYLFYRKEIFLKSYLLRQLLLIIAAIISLAPLIVSYYRLLPLYARFQPTVQANSLNVGFTLPSYISFLFPFSTIKNMSWFGTDVSMRNAYFSIAGLILLFCVLFQQKRSALQRVFLITAVFMLLLSFGGMLKKTLYQILPFLQFIRTNGEFRVFAIFSFIICIAFALNDIFLQKQQVTAAVKKLMNYASILLAAIVIVTALFSKENTALFLSNATVSAQLKFIIDHLSFIQSLFISAGAAFIFCLLYSYSLQRRKSRHFTTILIADLIVNCWLLLPVTGVSQTSVSKMQALISKSPEGFSATVLYDTMTRQSVTPEEEKRIGNWNWYSKKINVSKKIDYPSVLKSTETFLGSADTTCILHKPYIFLKNSNGTVSLKTFSPIEIIANVRLNKADTLVLLQNSYPGWKAWVNEKEVPISLYHGNFMQLPVDGETTQVRFRFLMF